MRVHRRLNRTGKRVYFRFSIDVSAEEAAEFLRFGKVWEVEDVAKTGYILLKVKKSPTSMRALLAKAQEPEFRRISARLHLTDGEWGRYDEIVRSKGLTICRALSNHVQATIAAEDHLIDAPVTVQVINIFDHTKARSRTGRDVARGVVPPDSRSIGK